MNEGIKKDIQYLLLMYECYIEDMGGAAWENEKFINLTNESRRGLNMNTIDEYVYKCVKLGVKDQILYDEIKPETEIEMDKIIEEAATKFSYLEIGEYIHRNFDIVIK